MKFRAVQTLHILNTQQESRHYRVEQLYLQKHIRLQNEELKSLLEKLTREHLYRLQHISASYIPFRAAEISALISSRFKFATPFSFALSAIVFIALRMFNGIRFRIISFLLL